MCIGECYFSRVRQNTGGNIGNLGHQESAEMPQFSWEFGVI